ncbi:hypothetical protein DFH09DRAFT_1084800 [Mycena vulgaris]|nr:hypothetical protein DFH09DRAFT_1084800 [Mycena vulgaris]
MPCELPFFPNANNYVDDGEHDKNSRKYWYLILREGLFTLKSDADALSAPDDILILFTKAQAQRLWDMHCHKHHKHKQDDRAPEYSSDEAAALKSPPSARSSSHTRRPARSPSPSAAVSNRKPTSIGAKREASAPVKRERDVVAQRTVKRDGDVTVMRGTSAPVKVEARTPCKLPLYLDGSDDSSEDDAGLVAERVELAEARVNVPLLLYIDDSPPPSRKRASPSTPTAGSKRARGCPLELGVFNLDRPVLSLDSGARDADPAVFSFGAAPRPSCRCQAIGSGCLKGRRIGVRQRLYLPVVQQRDADHLQRREQGSGGDEPAGQRAGRGMRGFGGVCAGKSGKVSGKRSG